MDIGGLEDAITGSRLLTAEDVAELTEHIERLEAADHEMWVRMTHMELHECPGCANVADLQEALEENAKLREQGARLFDKTLELGTENAKLRELVDGLRYCAHEAYGMCARVPVGGERPFTCCPLYDFDSKEYRCEKLMRELGIEVSDG